jgi:hypothetical protein
VAKTQQRAGEDPRLDLLAAVMLHTLVSEGRKGLNQTSIAVACQRDPNDSAEMGEIGAALRVLLDDGLAERKNGLYQPTRAAIRADELSF